MEEEKKTRVTKQNERQVQNVKTAIKKGKPVPASVKLTSDLPEHGKGNILQRKGLEKEVCTIVAHVQECLDYVPHFESLMFAYKCYSNKKRATLVDTLANSSRL